MIDSADEKMTVIIVSVLSLGITKDTFITKLRVYCIQLHTYNNKVDIISKTHTIG